MNPTTTTMRQYYPHILAALLVLICATLWLRNWQQESAANQVGVTVKAAPAKEVKSVPKIPVVLKKPAKVYAGGAALKDGIKLPAGVVHDDAQQVLASSQIAGGDDHPKTVTALINTETGEGNIYVRTDPLPIFAWSSRGGAGMYAGMKNGTPTVRLQVHQELFTVKAVHFGAVASLDQPMQGPLGADYFIGLGAEYRW